LRVFFALIFFAVDDKVIIMLYYYRLLRMEGFLVAFYRLRSQALNG